MIDIDINKTLFGSNGEMDLEINLSIKRGEFVSVFGTSGSGKTTFLRILAGLESAKGTIKVDNKIWLEKDKALPPQKRDIGFVFQDYALFMNMNIEDNLLYVNNDKNLAQKLLEITELKKIKKRLPSTLSGGQKQRVALCRAMMKQPKLLLMDEPLSALDVAMRNRLQDEILTLHKEFDTTILMVSHDPSEIYRLSSRVIVINQGKIIDDGSPKETLMKTSGSQKFTFEGKILDIIQVDVIYIAIISIGQQLVEIVISENESSNLKIGQRVSVSTKAFSPLIKVLDI